MANFNEVLDGAFEVRDVFLLMEGVGREGVDITITDDTTIGELLKAMGLSSGALLDKVDDVIDLLERV